MSVNLRDLWPCRSSLCRSVKERRPGAARRDERGDGRVHHQGRAARRRELWLRRRDQEENEWPGQPTAGIQPLGGTNPNPMPAVSPTMCFLWVTPRVASKGLCAIWPPGGSAQPEGQGKADGLYPSRLSEPRVNVA